MASEYKPIQHDRQMYMTKKHSKWLLAGLTTLFLAASATRLIAASQAGPVVSNVLSNTVNGRVVSEYGPVENTRVRIAGESDYALTDDQGRFTLQSAHLPGWRLMIAAGKEGWFNNGTAVVHGGKMPDIFLNAVPRADNPDYGFISPVVCSRCHTKVTQYYDQSKMAHTSSNPKVLQMYYGTDALKRTGQGPGYKLDNPGRDGDCIACHAPSIAASNPQSKDLLDALYSVRSEWDGLSCDYCHKVRQVLKDPQKASGYKAVLERQSARSGNSILVFGPYDDVTAPPMAASYNPLFQEGRYCSQCHSHFKTLADGKTWDWKKIYTAAEWRGFGLEQGRTLPVQTTYQEWKQWQDNLSVDDPNKGKRCQDCHMSWRKEMLPYDNYVIDGHARDMWGTYRDPKNIRPHHFDGGTTTQLQTALSMEIEGQVENNVLTVSVYITNTNGGHWVPTGETMRSVLLLLDVRDESGKPLKMIEGQRLPQWAGDGEPGRDNYAGRAGAVFARVLQDAQGNLNVPFWQAVSVASDTRIRPKTTVSLTYKFAVADPKNEPTATAELVYRPAHKALAASKKWDVQDIPIASAAW
jgi:hypothetical protein